MTKLPFQFFFKVLDKTEINVVEKVEFESKGLGNLFILVLHYKIQDITVQDATKYQYFQPVPLFIRQFQPR